MSTPRRPLPLRIYSVAANLAAPLAYNRISIKLATQGIGRERQRERKGLATKKRPRGTCLWFHAASVGESLSVLNLISRIGEECPNWNFLLTSGTATSAEILASRLPERTIHQFAPLDSTASIDRFLNYWQPDAAIFVESELWPNMLTTTRCRNIPLALINARISEKSARSWKRFPATASFLLNQFRMIHCQDSRTAAHLTDLGLSRARSGINLKSLSGPLPFDHNAIREMREAIGNHPVWLASSTHAGEDEIMLSAHRKTLEANKHGLLILVPRHPHRGDDIEKLIADFGMRHSRRSKGGNVSGKIQVHLADTLGETGLWYKLSPITCLCGSFSDVGGHNPYEPAFAGSAILHGPRYANFKGAYTDLDACGAGIEVRDANSLADKLSHLAENPEALGNMREKALNFAFGQQNVLGEFADELCNALELKMR
ncbi:MAG: 3-deoxy-D-manno-octulosonic acid transferase [Roseovarius sp.]|nr:3-deoxy-D-manno-octulosonic acid transferase [Roseovarius sp.]